MNFNVAAKQFCQIGFHGLAVHANSIGTFEQSAARRHRAGRANAESGRLARNNGDEIVVHGFQPIKNMLIAMLALGRDAFAGDFLAVGVENNAFDFCAA